MGHHFLNGEDAESAVAFVREEHFWDSIESKLAGLLSVEEVIVVLLDHRTPPWIYQKRLHFRGSRKMTKMNGFIYSIWLRFVGSNCIKTNQT